MLAGWLSRVRIWQPPRDRSLFALLPVFGVGAIRFMQGASLIYCFNLYCAELTVVRLPIKKDRAHGAYIVVPFCPWRRSPDSIHRA